MSEKKEITMEITWDTDKLYEEHTSEEADEIINNLPDETTFTITDTFGEAEEMDYLTSHYGCLVVALSETEDEN